MVFSFISFGCISINSKAEIIYESQVKKVTFRSKSLGKSMRFNIYLPKSYKNGKKYPVLYFLHGYTDNEDAWMPDLKLKETADRLIENDKIKPLIIVMPQIDNSFGINTDELINMSLDFSAGKYEDYLYKDLIHYIDSNYNTIKNRNSRYIGGLSMGGFAALHLAFRHINLFSKVGGHSPAFIEALWLYPNEELRNERDPIKIALKENLKSIQVYLDCGDNDSFKFYNGCNQLYTILQLKGVHSEYHLNSGEHNAEYWIANSEKYLLFYAGK